MRGDKNPYFQMGDAIVRQPDRRRRRPLWCQPHQHEEPVRQQGGFTDYSGFGVPANVQAIMALPGSAPVVNPNGYTGGNGGGSNWSALSAGTFGTKREFQTNHSVTGSITKVRGRWVHKGGMEFRNLLSQLLGPRAGIGRDAVAVRAFRAATTTSSTRPPAAASPRS